MGLAGVTLDLVKVGEAAVQTHIHTGESVSWEGTATSSHKRRTYARAMA
jgi:hypothetical protein